MFLHFVLLAKFHVTSQPQPPFCHLQENQFDVRVFDPLSQLGAGLGIGSVRIATIHESAQNLASVTIACHRNAAPNPKCHIHPLVPFFVMELVSNLWNAGLSLLVSSFGLLQPVVAPMYASECRRYAEQCVQLAQALGPQHRDLLLGWAVEWRRVAEELEELEPQEDQVQQ